MEKSGGMSALFGPTFEGEVGIFSGRGDCQGFSPGGDNVLKTTEINLTAQYFNTYHFSKNKLEMSVMLTLCLPLIINSLYVDCHYFIM